MDAALTAAERLVCEMRNSKRRDGGERGARRLMGAAERGAKDRDLR